MQSKELLLVYVLTALAVAIPLLLLDFRLSPVNNLSFHLLVLHSVLLSQFVIGLISTNQHWFACAPLSEAELERVSLNAS
jgi:heme/copper-type cytochrome/quinol oxidase subunit 1